MFIALLFLAVFVATAAVFIIVRSMILKMVAGFIFITSLVMVFVFFGDSIKAKTTPIAMGDGVVQLYVEGEKIIIPKDQINRVYVGKPGSKVKLEFITNGQIVAVEVSEFAYEWTIKNSLKREFKSKLDVAQF